MENNNANSDHSQDEVLPLEIDFIPERVLLKADEELPVSPDEKNSKLLELIKLLEGNSSTTSIAYHPDFLQRYLIHSRYDVNRAFSRVRNYISLRKHHNYYFQSLKFDFTSHPSCKFVTLLPYRSSDGSITLLYELGKWNPDEISFEVFKQLPFMIYMQELRNPVTQIAGINAIFDFQNTTLQQLKYCTVYNMYLLNHVTFEVVPVIFRGYHLVNGTSIMNTFLTLIKPFMPPFIKKILHIHSSPEKLLDYFPKSILPTKYGGSLQEYYMADKLKKINEQHDNYPVEGQKNTF